ncbi:serine-rich adhesin for platelets-like [Haliotis asinina]|uniref:serine-rich adhesin for platelets-like n=1 Tax=Haliotis asinina TaxID=109174 RepID=UPI0035324C55
MSSKLTVLFILAVVSCVQSDSLTGKQFYIYNDNRRWNEARKICEDEGGRLAQIDNQQTLDALLAYAGTNHWKDNMVSHFWIGLNRDDTAHNLRWDHCESVDSSSFTFWKDSSQDNTKLCVYAEKDKLGWISEVCDSSSYQYLCQKDAGPCTYTEFSGTCTGSGHDKISHVPLENVTQCEDLCSNTLQDELACWMYSYDSHNCTLYFDKNPWACSKPSANSTAKTRVCFTFETRTSSSSYTSSEQKPIINCDLYTTQATTTTMATTTTVIPLVGSSIATNTSTMDAILPGVTNSSENTTSLSNNTEATNNRGPTNTSNSDSIAASTTSYTTMEAPMSSAKDPYIPSAYFTMTTHPTNPGTEGTTTATSPTTPATASMTKATISTSLVTTRITKATDSITVTAASITMETTETYPASKLTDSSRGKDTCPCLVCVETKTMFEKQRFVDAIVLLLKLDKSKLSATRRKRKSEPDDRPSAQAIGYSGIILIVITFSFFVVNDLMRLCQFWSGKSDRNDDGGMMMILRGLTSVFGFDNLADARIGVEPCPTPVQTDFESAAIRATEEAFPDADIRGCFFHYTQAIQRRAAEEGI